MKYRVLGPLEVDAGAGPLPLAGKPQALMALLLLHANETLSADRIAEELACEAVEDVVSRLRGILPEDVLETHWGGYRLRVPDGALDLQRFEALARQAGRAEPEQAARLLREALALWRGPPLAGMREPFARWRGRAARGPSRLALDAELEALIERHPRRERFMLSLYRAPGPQQRGAADRRAPAHPHRSGRQRKDAAGARPGPRGGARLPRRRALRLARGRGGPGPGHDHDPARARPAPGASPSRRARRRNSATPAHCWCSTTSTMCARRRWTWPCCSGARAA